MRISEGFLKKLNKNQTNYKFSEIPKSVKCLKLVCFTIRGLIEIQ